MGLVALYMWNLLGPGIEPMSPVLAGEFLTTGPSGKSKFCIFCLRHWRDWMWTQTYWEPFFYQKGGSYRDREKASCDVSVCKTAVLPIGLSSYIHQSFSFPFPPSFPSLSWFELWNCVLNINRKKQAILVATIIEHFLCVRHYFHYYYA